MSDTSTISPRRGAGLETILIGAAVLVLVLGLSFLSNRSQQEVRRTPSGFDGLVHWLNTQSVPSRSFSGGYSIDPDTIGILVVPIFDTDLLATRDQPRTKQDLLLQLDEYDLDLSAILKKRANIPTVIALPKWRSGMRLTRLAHPVLLNDRSAAQKTMNVVSSGTAHKLSVIPVPFSEFDYIAQDGSILTAQTYVSRVFASEDCDPLIGTQQAMILGKCVFKDQRPFFILSDPDLFNNHGLRLGDNARIAKDFFAREAGNDLVLVDRSSEFWFAKEREFTRPERTWADLAQFFAYPFSLLWLGAGTLLVLSIWRAGIRFGPIRHEISAPGAAKKLAIDARARLLRLNGNNRAMLAQYTDARLSVLLADTFGPALADNKQMGLSMLAKKSPDPVARLVSLLGRLTERTDPTTSHEAIALVDEFETLIGEIENDT